MTKVFALLSIVAVFGFASCESKAPVETPTDSVEAVVPVDTTPVVTTVDSAKVDTTKAAH